MEKMETAETRITSLEKRTDKHGTEIDILEERIHIVESNQKVFQLQLEALQKIENELKEMNKGLLRVNDTVIESKHKLEMVANSQSEDREEIRTLKKQRDLDHNVKPLEKIDKYWGQIVSLFLAAIAGIIFAKIGLR